jgi:hypothetical protein
MVFSCFSIERKFLIICILVSAAVQRSLFLLSDHSYTSVKISHELGSAQHGTSIYTKLFHSVKSYSNAPFLFFVDDLVSKLSAKCQEIQISCRDQLLCVKLCPRTSILRNSLNSNVISTNLVVQCDFIKHSSVIISLDFERAVHGVAKAKNGNINPCGLNHLIWTGFLQRNRLSFSYTRQYGSKAGISHDHRE